MLRNLSIFHALGLHLDVLHLVRPRLPALLLLDHPASDHPLEH